jgi:6-phosphogluconolactonase/glucosamine-6-phosphate isomerase/deaminase
MYSNLKIYHLSQKGCIEYFNDYLVKIKQSNNQSLIISGGTSPIYIYKAINKNLDLKKFKFYLSDERLSFYDYTKTNLYNLSKIFKENLMTNNLSKVFNEKNQNVNDYYNSFIKDFENNDIKHAFLGIGEDGHIASLFAKENIEEITKKKKFVLVKKYNEIFNRVSVSKKFLIDLDKICFFISNNKLQIIEKIKKNNFSISPNIDYLLQKNKKIEILIEE